MAKTIDRWTPEGKRFLAEIEKLKKLEVRIGFQQGAQDEDGVDMVDIAMWNELGTVNMPARPFMRDSVDNHTDVIEAFAQAQVNTLAGGGTAESVLKNMGVMQKAMIQNEIDEGSFAANAPSTVRRKKSDKPLIDTGRMRQSVQFVIKPKGAE